MKIWNVHFNTLIMSKKQDLLNKMIHNPRIFTDYDFYALVRNDEDPLTFEDLRENIKRIYDINETTLLSYSDPMKGIFGYLNNCKKAKRSKLFFKRMKKGLRNDNNKTIVAEGDSWFCFPIYVKDINEWILEDKSINLYSIAEAGDWIADMIYRGKYVEELSLIKPDVFLISGGGNDFIGDNRLSYMVDHLSNETNSTEMITSLFFSFILTLKAQYWLLFMGIQKSGKFNRLKIITQGYDYVIPSNKKFRSINLIQGIINSFTGTGKWLYLSLMMKGILDVESQKEITHVFIDKVNEMFEWLATHKENGNYTFPNLYHVDNRGVARGYDDWFDEIHLKSDRFKIVADAYKYIINEGKTKKGKLFNQNEKVIVTVNEF